MTETTTQYGSPVLDKVATLVAPIISDLGLEIYDLEFASGTLRITVDTPAGQESGVSLDTIALATRLIGREFDHADPVPGRYTLEITSPGLERPLRKPAHFARELGKEVAVRLVAAIDGHRRVQGVLVRSDAVTATVALEAGEFTFPIDQVERAKTVFVWGPAPKPGKAPKGKAAKSKGARISESQNSDTQTEETKS
jgi:ribosome maturation factor RimP